MQTPEARRRDLRGPSLLARFFLPSDDAECVVGDWLEHEASRAPDERAPALHVWARAALLPILFWSFRLRCAVAGLWDRLARAGGALGRVSGALAVDTHHAGRGLLRSPGLTAVAALALAIAIGVNAVMFAFVRNVLRSPAAIDDPARVVEVIGFDASSPARRFVHTSCLNLADYRDRASSFSGLAVHVGAGAASVTRTVTEPAGAAVPVTLVSGNYFGVLGVKPAHGAVIDLPQAADAELGAHPIAVISHGLWESRYDANPDVVGTTIFVDGLPVEIVGVAPQGFIGLPSVRPTVSVWSNRSVAWGLAGAVAADAKGHVWIHNSMRQEMLSEKMRAVQESRRAAGCLAVGRLRDDVDRTAAELELAAIGRDLDARHADSRTAIRPVALTPVSGVHPLMRSSLERCFAILGVAALVVLVVACVSIGSLFLTRAAARERDIAVRMALGGRRVRIFRQAAIECLLLAGFAGVLGLGLAVAADLRLQLLGILVPGPEGLTIRVEPELLVFTFAAVLMATLLFGWLPTQQLARGDVAERLREGRHRRQLSSRPWVRRCLVTAQASLVVLGLAGAGAVLQGAERLGRVDPGFRMDEVGLAAINLSSIESRAEQERALERIAVRVTKLDTVRSVAFSDHYPLGGGLMRTVRADESPVAEMYATANPVSEGYFATLGLELLGGRPLLESDTFGSRRVAVVNQVLAETLWPERDPLGRTFRFHGSDEPIEVVGVAANQLLHVGSSERPVVYTAFRQWLDPSAVLNVRVHGAPPAALDDVRQAIQSVAPSVLVTEMATGETMVDYYLWGTRTLGRLLALFGAVALGLAAIGIYGVVAHATAWRRREMGIRLAHGASPRSVVTLLIGDGLAPVAVGTVLGFALALAGVAAMPGSFGISPAADVTGSLWAALVVLPVAFVATYFPARHAVRLDPVRVLRAE